MKILGESDINWINNITYDKNTNYELEIRFRINEKKIYEEILCNFKHIKDFKLNNIKKIIEDDIIYKEGYKIVKRNENNDIMCYTKKILKSKHLENIPGVIYLCSERVFKMSLFNEDDKIKKKKKRNSFYNDFISFDFTESDNEYNIEIEFLNPNKYKANKLQELFIKYVNPFINILPKEIRVLYEINRYKKYIKQPSSLKDIKDIKYKFCVTPKFDGIRCQLYINTKQEIFLITNNFNKVICTNLETNINNVLIDGELIDDRIFYAFDLIIYKNNILEDKCIFERLNILRHDIYINYDKSQILYKMKEYYFNDIYKDSKKIIRKKYSYTYDSKEHNIPKDGLIFIDVKSNYLNSIIFKWKKDVTFDFKIEKLNSDNKKEEWCLKCYNKNNDYVIFKNKEIVDFKDAQNYKNNDIVEFKYNKNQNIFIPIKNRKDKKLPNFIDIANDNMESLIKYIKF
jgi:hypothetical protein